MSARVEADAQAALTGGLPSTVAPLAALPIAFDNDDQFGGPALPSDHPAWLKDAVSLSQRARALIVKLKPIALAVIHAWEHRVRSVVIAGRKVSVDASGSYRMD